MEFIDAHDRDPIGAGYTDASPRELIERFDPIGSSAPMSYDGTRIQRREPGATMPSHNDRPTIRQLEYLVAIADEGSFSRAAQRCHVSQPTLSGQVKLLESRIGVECFERTPRGVFVTPQGEAIIEHARTTIAAVDGLLGAANANVEPLSGEMRLGVVSTITPYLLPAVVAELAHDYPELDLVLFDDVGDRLKDRLQKGELDAIVTPLPVELPGFEEMAFGVDPFVLVAAAGTPLGDLPEPVELEDLRDAPIILLDDPHCIRGQALDLCRRARCSPNLSIHATSISALVQLVRHGMGATLLPALSIDVEMRWLKELRIKRFAVPSPGRQLAIVWREGSPRRDGFLLLGQILMRHVLTKSPLETPSEDATG